MHVSELTADERDSFDRAMTTIESMDDADRRQILEHAVASSIRYAWTGPVRSAAPIG